MRLPASLGGGNSDFVHPPRPAESHQCLRDFFTPAHVPNCQLLQRHNSSQSEQECLPTRMIKIDSKSLYYRRDQCSTEPHVFRPSLFLDYRTGFVTLHIHTPPHNSCAQIYCEVVMRRRYTRRYGFEWALSETSSTPNTSSR